MKKLLCQPPEKLIFVIAVLIMTAIALTSCTASKKTGCYFKEKMCGY